MRHAHEKAWTTRMTLMGGITTAKRLVWGSFPSVVGSEGREKTSKNPPLLLLVHMEALETTCSLWVSLNEEADPGGELCGARKGSYYVILNIMLQII
jgi:hypothetical protein